MSDTSLMAKRIKDKRIENNLTMEELGKKLGVQKSAVHKWETGLVENIKQTTIKKMADIFGCSPTWLMGFDDEPQPNTDNVALLLYEAPGIFDDTFIMEYAKADEKKKALLKAYWELLNK